MADVKVPAKLHLMSKAAQKAWYKKNNMEMPKEKSVAQAGKIKPAEKKAAAPVKPKSAREISMERQKAYYAKGGRAPIGAGGSGGSSAMAGVGQSSAKEIIKGIKAGINPKVALVRYTQEQKVFETNGEYNRYGHPKAGSVDIDPTPSDKPPVYKKRPVAQFKKVQEATKQEAEKLLGGPVKEKPKMPAGKQPAEYRYVRNLARKAMKAGMKKEEVEQVDEANMRFDYEAAARPKSSDVKNFLNRDKNPRAAAASKKYIRRMTKLGGLGPNQTKKDTEAHMKAQFEEVEYIEEKLTAADPASKWISDFVASDNPKFAGKSKKERINMALGAYYSATGKGKQAEELNFQEAKKMDDMEDDYEDKMKDDEEDDMEDDNEEENKKKVDEKYMGFKAVMASAKKGGARNPAAVAAAIGRKKYGKEKFQAAAAAGKKLGEEVEQVDEQSPAEIKAKYYHDQFNKVKPVKAYDKDGKLVGRYRSMDHAKQMKPGHTYKVEEEVEQVKEGFDPDPSDIAAQLVKKHGKGKVTKDHIDAYERDRDSNRAIDKEAVMKHVKKMAEGLDPVGREDKDVDNDGDSDKTDLYLSKRRKAISSAIRKKVSDKMGK